MGASGIIGSLVDQNSGAATSERVAFLFALVLVPALLQIGSPVDIVTIQPPLPLICAGICVATVIYIVAGVLIVFALRLIVGEL
jgi:hypothetical protein